MTGTGGKFGKLRQPRDRPLKRRIAAELEGGSPNDQGTRSDGGLPLESQIGGPPSGGRLLTPRSWREIVRQCRDVTGIGDQPRHSRRGGSAPGCDRWRHRRRRDGPAESAMSSGPVGCPTTRSTLRPEGRASIAAVAPKSSNVNRPPRVSSNSRRVPPTVISPVASGGAVAGAQRGPLHRGRRAPRTEPR